MNSNINNEYNEYAISRLDGSFGEMSSWRFVRPYLEGRRVLDIGCSDGLYLRYMGHDSIGIEQVHALAESARSKGYDVICGDVTEALRTQQDAKFEGVLFSHVMEHVDAPIETLREINRVLENRGVLVLGLPIERNIYRDLLRMDYFDGTHIYAFSVRNAMKLLEETGFTPEKVFFHLPKCRNNVGGWLERIWNKVPLPFRTYFSMAYWIVAVKQ